MQQRSIYQQKEKSGYTLQGKARGNKDCSSYIIVSGKEIVDEEKQTIIRRVIIFEGTVSQL